VHHRCITDTMPIAMTRIVARQAALVGSSLARVYIPRVYIYGSYKEASRAFSVLPLGLLADAVLGWWGIDRRPR
jgi:hypothetical protein